MSNVALACALALTCLMGCAPGATQDRALFQMFWVDPKDIMARMTLPQGLGLQSSPELVMSLVGHPGQTPRMARFRLVSAHMHDDAGSPQYRLAHRDYSRFRAMQDRVVANIGSRARIAIALDIAYCSDGPITAARRAPVAEVYDTSTGQKLMVRPATESARALQARIPEC